MDMCTVPRQLYGSRIEDSRSLGRAHVTHAAWGGRYLGTWVGSQVGSAQCPSSGGFGWMQQTHSSVKQAGR